VTETLAKFGMGALLAAAIPANGDPGLWANWGLAGLVVGYTLWRDWQREKRMSESLEKHQSWTQETLMDALARNTIAMERLLTALKEGKKDAGGTVANR
jgi:hypothetical protein